MNTPVSFELAKLLKEKGFDKPCNISYDKQYGNVCHTTRADKNSELISYVSAPTIAEVVMWLYEKYGIWISVSFRSTYTYYFTIVSVIKGEEDVFVFGDEKNILNNFNEPTEAYEAAIEYCLNNIKLT